MRRVFQSPIFRLGLLSAFSFLVGFSYNYHLPKIETLLLVEVERLSQKHSPVRIWAQQLHFHLLPLGIVLEDVRILPQKPLNRYLAPARLREAGARLAIWPLLRGEIRLAQVFVRDSDINIFLREELFAETDRPRSKPNFSFEQIYRLPVDEISLESVQIQGRLEPQNVVFRTGQTNLLIENRYQSLFVDLEAPNVQIKPSGPIKPLDVALEVRALVEANEMQISAFKLKADDSFVVASGRFNGDIAAGHLENGAFDARTKILLPDINRWEHIFFLQPRVPPLLGRAEVDFGMEVRSGKGFHIDADLLIDDLHVDKYKIGTLKSRLGSDLKSIVSDNVQLESDAGRAALKNFKMSFSPDITATAQVKIENVELRQLLNNIDIKKVPISILASAEGPCQATLKPKIELQCHADMQVPKLLVHTDPPKKSTIVEANDWRGQGDVILTDKDLNFKAELQLGKNSKGRAHGQVNYETGFKVFYEADLLDLSDVKNLSNLKLEGRTKLDGSTTGGSKWGVIDMNVEAEDFWLEDYPFGKLKGKIGYKASQLTLDHVEGQYGVSQYVGAVGIDLHEQRIRINGNIPFADLHDLQQIFQRKIQLPFEVSGTGQGQIEASGPFRFNEMSYKVRSNFFRGEIAGETFDEFAFNVTSKDGYVTSDRITLVKSSGVADVKGQINPKGEIDSVVVGRSMRLEQSENVLKYGLDLQGLADFTVLIRGQLPRPRIELNGRLSRVVMADQSAQDSVFKLNFLTDRVEGSGQFFGTTVLADATFPYTLEAPFLLKMRVQKWDYTSLFTLVSKSAKQLDFSTLVSGQINLSAPKGGFWASSGQVAVEEFVIRKGSKQLAATKPMYLTMFEGELNSNGFQVSSGDSYLKLDVAGLRRDRLNASVNGKLDLSLLGLFTPFIADLRGQMAISMDLKGSVDKANLSGSAYVDKAYVKFVDFVHPFANIRADMIFNDNQILINSVKADMAGGKLAGDGRITFAGKKSRPIEIKGSFNDVKINVPEGFRTQGSGNVTITGDNFPYTMGINYSVVGGEVVYEIGEDTSSAASVKASAFLPRFLYQESFHPFTFNLDVSLKNPVLVNNALAQTQVSGRIAATGTPDRLLLTGTLTPLPGGKVFFRDTPFEISSAFFEYNGSPPSEPKIFLTANTRVTEVTQDDQARTARTSERQFEINLLAQGRGPIPQIILSSQPPLPQQDIVSLLALGVTTSGLDEKNSSDRNAATSSAALGATLLQKAGGKRIKESLGVDVKVSSSQPTPDNASTPKVTFSKQWTPKLGASASSTLQANPTNDVKIEYKMNKNVSVVGSWNGREYVQEQKDATKNVFGLDLEYKMQFK